MGYGLFIKNPAGELVIGTEGITYGYLGQATFVSTTAPGTTANSSMGYSTYTFAFAGNILVALPLNTTGTCALLGMGQSAGVWTISVHQSDGTTNSAGFDNETAPAAVYVFGAPESTPSGWGMNLFDAAGTICARLDRQPPAIRGRVQMSSSVASMAMPTVTTPAIIGGTADRSTSGIAAGVNWDNHYYARGWKLSGSTLVRQIYQTERALEGASAGSTNFINPVNAILIEADGL